MSRILTSGDNCFNPKGFFLLFFSFNKPEVMTEVAALEIVRDHSLYYKVRSVFLYLRSPTTMIIIIISQELGDDSLSRNDLLALPGRLTHMCT